MKLFGMVGGLAMLIVFLGETQTNDLNSILIAIGLELKYCICIDEYKDSRISYIIGISNKTTFSMMHIKMNRKMSTIYSYKEGKFVIDFLSET